MARCSLGAQVVSHPGINWTDAMLSFGMAVHCLLSDHGLEPLLTSFALLLLAGVEWLGELTRGTDCRTEYVGRCGSLSLRKRFIFSRALIPAFHCPGLLCQEETPSPAGRTRRHQYQKGTESAQ